MKSIECTTTYARLNRISIDVLLSEDKCFMLCTRYGISNQIISRSKQIKAIIIFFMG